jgi:hypothetical protein
MMRTQIVKTFLSCACILSIVSSASAGRVDVVNENKKLLKVKIKAEGDNINENLMTYSKDISAEHHSTFDVNSADLNGKSHYSIKGDTNSFTAGGKCHHLSVEKNYKVTFLNDTAGTSCVAEEIK